MNMNTVSRQELSAVEWDAVVKASPDGWVFSLWGWQELIETVEPWALEDHSFAIREGRRLLAVVPLHYDPGSGRMASSGWGGSGPILDYRLDEKVRDNIMGRAIQHCIELARERGAAGFDVSLSPVTTTAISSDWGINPLVFHGLEDCSGLAQVIDLSKSEDELWADLKSDTRRQIKKAREAGLVVERVDWAQHLGHYYELHVATYTRTGVQPHPRAYFSGIAAHTAPTGYSVLWSVRTTSGETIAYHNAAWYGAGASYHTGCSTQSAGLSGASYLLFWEAMLGAKHEGIRWYDCGAIFPGAVGSEKQKGLSTFKTKFGGQPHRHFSASLNFSAHDAVSSVDVLSPSFGLRRIIGFGIHMPRRFLRWIGTKLIVTLRSFLPKIRFIRPFWSWREIATALLWNEAKSLPSKRLVSSFCGILDYSGKGNIFFLSSGRSSLEVVFLGLKSAGAGRSKVVLPSYGCLGILQPVLNAGLSPYFIDIDCDLSPSEEDAVASLDEDTLAVLLVHLSGRGKRYNKVRARAKELGIFVVDDYCHNLGGQPPVRDVDIAVFSFSMGKNASASAGGAIIDNLGISAIKNLVDSLTIEPSYNAKARFRHFLSLYGQFWWRFFGERLPVGSEELKARYRLFTMSDLDAQLLFLQLSKLDEIIERRRRNANQLINAVDGIDGIYNFQSRDDHIYTKLTVTLETHKIFEAFMPFMNMRGIEIEGMYSPLHFRDEVVGIHRRPLDKTMDVFARVANIPVRPNLSRCQLRRIERALQQFSQGVERG
jgi:dTDP-4-amino-4,6-dideoxygalactose transaminase